MNFKLTTHDGYEIHCTYDTVAHPKGVLVFSHGFVEYSAHYLKLARMVNQNGYNLFRYDLRGHGRTTAPLGDLNDYNDFADDLNQCITWIQNEDASLPLFTMGFSLGGMITTLYGILYPLKSVGQILLGPGLTPRPQFMNIEHDAITVPEFLSMSGTDGDEGIKQLVATKSPYILSTITHTFLSEAFYKAQCFILDSLDHYTSPVLVLHGKEDPMVSYHSSEAFVDAIHSTDKTLHVYDGYYHDLLRLKDSQQFVDVITAWCDKHLL